MSFDGDYVGVSSLTTLMRNTSGVIRAVLTDEFGDIDKERDLLDKWSPLKDIYANLEFFRSKFLLRPQEITNSPEIVRRIGIVSINTAIEVDVAGNVNSTHVLGRNMMNGIGGSGDFARNAFLSIFTCPSTAKGGKISTIVPHVSHLDHSEHSVQIIVTEQGVADLRGKSPAERARTIIENCAHPEYRDILRDYVKLAGNSHSPQTLSAAFGLHVAFERGGDMRTVNWSNCK